MVKNPSARAGAAGNKSSVAELGRSSALVLLSGESHGQRNLVAIVHKVTESDTTAQLSMHAH